MKRQICPICSREVESSSRYPSYICPDCVATAQSRDDRPVRFFNEDISGGFVASHGDTNEKSEDHICYINRIKCRADEAYMGGIVVQPVRKKDRNPEALIVVTNDDGIESPGLRAAVEAVLFLGEVIVVAPSNQQTSAGRALHGDQNGAFQKVRFSVDGKTVTGYHCDCSPARAVLHAFDVLFSKRPPDLLVSGINYGENLGTNVTISGTVGAALQAATHGVPALAMSLQTDIENHRRHVELDWGAARNFCRRFADWILNESLPRDVDILNVNVPATATSETPWKVTRLSRQNYFVNHMAKPTLKSKIGEATCRIGYDEVSLERDSDIRAVHSGLVSVTPISMDMTARIDLNAFLNGGADLTDGSG
jgi:5'-nucleotidase